MLHQTSCDFKLFNNASSSFISIYIYTVYIYCIQYIHTHIQSSVQNILNHIPFLLSDRFKGFPSPSRAHCAAAIPSRGPSSGSPDLLDRDEIVLTDLATKDIFKLVASLLLVAMPGAPRSVLAPSSRARSPQHKA